MTDEIEAIKRRHEADCGFESDGMAYRQAAERPPHIYDTAGTYRAMIAAAPEGGV